MHSLKRYFSPYRRTRFCLLLGWMFFILVAVSLSLLRPRILQYVDSKIYDLILTSVPSGKPPEDIVIVTTDERSLARFGQWPWPRSQVALLLERVRRQGARAIALDILFAEADRTPESSADGKIWKELEPEEPNNTLAGATANDPLLRQVLGKGPFVLGHEFTFGDRNGNGQSRGIQPLPVYILASGEPAQEYGFYRASGVVGNLEMLAEAAPGTGFLNASSDRDGILRRIPLVIQFGDHLYPSLALATVVHVLAPEHIGVTVGPAGVEGLHIGKKRIPLDGQGNMLIDYRRAGAGFVQISAADILDGVVNPRSLQGKLVVIGAVGSGIDEQVTTPLGMSVSGVELQALAISNLLEGRAISEPPYLPLLETLAVFAIAGLSFLAFRQLHPFVGVPVMVAALCCLAGGSAWLLRSRGVFISPFLPMLTLGGLYPIIILLKHQAEEEKVEKRRIEHGLLQDFTTQSLATLAATRDDETGMHLMRTQRYLKVLCEEMASHPRFAPLLTSETIEILYKLAPLHDIGKVGLPDALLLKNGPLTPEEFEQMKHHTVFGLEALQKAERAAGLQEGQMIGFAKDLVLTHHERWDGGGYPQGLAGEEIPVPGRLMAVVDVYDALVSRRIYKDSILHEEAVRIIAEGRGTQFEPDIVDGFMRCEGRFREILSRSEEEPPFPLARTG